MTSKSNKTKRKKAGSQRGRIARLRASVSVEMSRSGWRRRIPGQSRDGTVRASKESPCAWIAKLLTGSNSRARLPDANQPDPAESDGGEQKKNGREVAARAGSNNFSAGDFQSPRPFKWIVCGLGEALSAMISFPVRTPFAFGLNDTSIAQLFPIARRFPQLFVCRKSPVAVMLENFSVAFPALVSLTFLGP